MLEIIQKNILRCFCIRSMPNPFGFSVFESAVLVITNVVFSRLVTPPMLCSSFIEILRLAPLSVMKTKLRVIGHRSLPLIGNYYPFPLIDRRFLIPATSIHDCVKTEESHTKNRKISSRIRIEYHNVIAQVQITRLFLQLNQSTLVHPYVSSNQVSSIASEFQAAQLC